MAGLPDIEESTTPPHTATETAFTVFLRIVAVISLVAGLKYWISLVGFFDYPPWRFDLMPVHWKLAATSLAVLFPVAATGLWLPVSWGRVMWVAAAGIETAMYGSVSAPFRPRAGGPVSARHSGDRLRRLPDRAPYPAKASE